MNLTVEETAKRVIREASEPDKVRVKVKVSWRNRICVPDENGKLEEEAIFSVLTFGDHRAFERAASYEMDSGDGRNKISVVEINEYKRLMVKRNLLGWTLDIPIKRDKNGWMTPQCYEQVSLISAPLMEAFISGFEESTEVEEEEERKIQRQCSILFSKNSRGVADPCEAVSLFCSLENFWEKFGLNRETLPKIPFRDYLLLKEMIGKESEAMRVNNRPRPQGSTTKIVGPGGRVTPSRGIVMPG